MRSQSMCGRSATVVAVVAASAAAASLLVPGVPAASASGNWSEWSAPVNLGAVVNTASSEQHPAISKDGLSLYITSNRPGGLGGQDIWVSHRDDEDSPWSAPVNLGAPVNTSADELAPCFSRDGHEMYLMSRRPGGFGDLDLYVSERGDVHDDFDWGTPVNLGADVNGSAIDAGPVLCTQEGSGGALYFNSTRTGGPGDFDIYRSFRNSDGSFGPASLVPELSTQYRDTRMAIRHDGREMILSTERPGGVDGRDNWVATRQSPSDPWSAPVALPAPVNAVGIDGAAALTGDGTTMVFYSARAGGFGGNDLYITTRDHQ